MPPRAACPFRPAPAHRPASLARPRPQNANPGVNPNQLSVNSYVKLPPWSDSCPAPGDNTQCRV